MSVQVKTPTKSNFTRVDIQSFSSPESVKRAKDDIFVKSEPKFSQPWGRKRRFSQSYRREEGAARRKRLKSSPCAGPLPNRFLNGGSIDDPLNLNGLESTELGRQLNAVTPESSPLPTPTRRESVEVRIPINVTDPLNLNDTNEDTDIEKWLRKKRQRNRHKKNDPHLFSPPKHMDKNLMEALKIDIEPDSEPSTSDSSKQKDIQQSQKTRTVSNKIVSPVIPQISPKNKKRRRTMSGGKPEPSQTVPRSLQSFTSNNQPGKQEKKSSPQKKFKQPKAPPRQSNSSSSKGGRKCSKFIYGNYSRYYGYRNPSLEEDRRLKCFKKEWFEEKCVLDIGCNAGHLTLTLACGFQPSKIVGLDIDPNLIMVARKNIRYYMSSGVVASSKFPVSNMMNYGPIEAPPVSKDAKKKSFFPHNVLFKQGNYVLECDELLDLQKEEYDVILALSVTKWIHFNWGDDGLKRFFKRVYKQLRPGGRFILEPQPWSSYKKKKKLTSEIHANFKSIRLRPEHFTDFLLSREVGFSTCYTLDVPYNASKGFRRPIMMFKKSDTIQNSPCSDRGRVSPVAFQTSNVSPIKETSSVYSEDTSSSSSSDSDWSRSSKSAQCSPCGRSAPDTPASVCSSCTSGCCVDSARNVPMETERVLEPVSKVSSAVDLMDSKVDEVTVELNLPQNKNLMAKNGSESNLGAASVDIKISIKPEPKAKVEVVVDAADKCATDSNNEIITDMELKINTNSCTKKDSNTEEKVRGELTDGANVTNEENEEGSLPFEVSQDIDEEESQDGADTGEATIEVAFENIENDNEG